MAGLSSPGLGSGLDINALISQLMAVEQQPLIALQRKEASYQAKISALGSLKGALSALQTSAEGLVPATGTTAADKYTTTRAGFGDTTLGSATATNSAAAGSYTLSEITLAKAEQVRKSGMSIPAGEGTLTITVGSGSAVEVDIAAGATLSSIRDAINASSAQVSAAIINDGSNDYLVLTADSSGVTNTITVAGSAGFEDFSYSSGTPNSWTQAVPPANASVKVNGIPVTSTTNTISTAIEGVTINLTKETTGSTTLTITKDHGSITSSLNAFITAFNSASTTIKGLGAYDSETKTASTLTGDSTLRSVDSRLSALFFTAFGSEGSSLQRLSDLGVSLQLDGTLKLDSSKLNTAVSNNFEEVANLIAGAGTSFKEAVSGMVGSSGTVTNKIEGINATIKLLDQRQEALQLSLARIEERYRQQFTALDVQLSNMQSLSSRLASMLSTIPSASNSSN
ncbi:MAG: Flagellar hook-associated protein 2 [Betaproteobacteria bacterium ADurb.Bin341]|nr:MAG: Flagellar hook-associated protein 2 [Betaproteobacteria bacterium ADurb.Bin341]